MALQFVPLAEKYIDAARAFNKRMREARAATSFLLPEETSEPPESAESSIQRQQLIALDDGEVRGGVIEVEQPGWLNGHTVRALNYQSPLSEGIIDRKSALIAAQMVKFMERRAEAVFIVGMGSADNRLPRLLKAAGWSLRGVPFLFRVHNKRAFLNQLPILHSSSVRHLVTRTASATGIGALALKLLQWRRTNPNGSIHRESCWGSWADEIWKGFREQCSFAVERDRKTLESLYPPSDSRLHILLVRHKGEPAGWAVCMEVQTKNSPYFGSLRVGAILDCAALPGTVSDTAVLADRYMAGRNMDLVFVNHSHAAWVRAFRLAGFLSGPSNYQIGMSKALAQAVRIQPGGDESVHVTRGDGDGRCNL